MRGDFAQAKRPLFDGLSMDIHDGSRLGILGPRKSGKSTLLRLICGTRVPDDGAIERCSRASWPIPLASFLVATLTVARNIRFVARLYGIKDEEFPRRIAEMVDLGEFLNTPLATCPKYVKQRLAFALGTGLDFDLYLFDGSVAPVDKPFREKAAEISAARTGVRGFVVATSLPAEVEDNCESAYVLESGRATYFAKAKEAVDHFKQLLAEENQKQQSAEQKPAESEDEEEGLGDVDLIAMAVADEL